MALGLLNVHCVARKQISRWVVKVFLVAQQLSPARGELGSGQHPSHPPFRPAQLSLGKLDLILIILLPTPSTSLFPPSPKSSQPATSLAQDYWCSLCFTKNLKASLFHSLSGLIPESSQSAKTAKSPDSVLMQLATGRFLSLPLNFGSTNFKKCQMKRTF